MLKDLASLLCTKKTADKHRLNEFIFSRLMAVLIKPVELAEAGGVSEALCERLSRFPRLLAQRHKFGSLGDD